MDQGETGRKVWFVSRNGGKRRVQADEAGIEEGGALTFWNELGENYTLVAAYREWDSVEEYVAPGVSN